MKKFAQTFACARTCAFQQVCRFQPIFTALGPTKVLSHITKCDVKIKDLDAMARACENLGLKLNIGQRTYRWYGRSVGDYPIPDGIKVEDLGKCSHAVHLNRDAYEIGLVDNHDGSYSMLWDFWSGGKGLQAVVGDNCKTLIGEYTIETARTAAQAQMWMTEDASDGTLIVYHPEGGRMIVNRDGTVEATGFIGQGCTASGIIENALGTSQETIYKDSYFVEKARNKQR